MVEDSVVDIVAEHYKAESVQATTSHQDAILNSEVSIICVGTPSSENDLLNLLDLLDVAKQIGTLLAEKEVFHTIVLHSSVPQDSNYRIGKIIERATREKKSTDYGVIFDL